MDICVKTARVAEGGRIVLPAEFRRKLGIADGDSLTLELRDNEIAVYTALEGWERARALVRRSIPASVSLVDELMAERRAEAERE